jgi:hypothetical protein
MVPGYLSPWLSPLDFSAVTLVRFPHAKKDGLAGEQDTISFEERPFRTVLPASNQTRTGSVAINGDHRLRDS